MVLTGLPADRVQDAHCAASLLSQLVSVSSDLAYLWHRCLPRMRWLRCGARSSLLLIRYSLCSSPAGCKGSCNAILTSKP